MPSPWELCGTDTASPCTGETDRLPLTRRLVAALTIQGDLSDDLSRNSAGPTVRSFANLEEDIKAGRTRQNDLKLFDPESSSSCRWQAPVVWLSHSEEHPVGGCLQGEFTACSVQMLGSEATKRIRCSQPHF